jgi:hypothetical protein
MKENLRSALQSFSSVAKDNFRLVTLIEYSAVASVLAGALLGVFAVVRLRCMEKHRTIEISMKPFERA